MHELGDRREVSTVYRGSLKGARGETEGGSDCIS